MDEDRLSPEFGRLIDAAKAAAQVLRAAYAGGAPAGAAAVCARAEGWALLGADGVISAGPDAEAALAAAAQVPGAEAKFLAAAVAVAGQSGDSLLPGGERPLRVPGLDADLPVAVKYLGRWVVIPLADMPAS